MADQTVPAPIQPSAQRGRLKIFLGAAPGVGKTYEMLLTAKARKADGVDVVIGVVETHGRAETASLIEGLEVIPSRPVTHGGQSLTEMDLDAILARRPAMVLVDELAHTNAPGSRHPKRWLDVEELLVAGIDVLTTLNIQHVESLNDVVARITRIRVRETVPDAFLDAADDIEIIDVTPDDLIRRLQDGKVYVPDQARRALERFFTRGNLTALRELALRRTADRVDNALVDHMRSHAIDGPWPAGDRLLVMVDAGADSEHRVRQARRMADRRRAPWIALYIETPQDAALDEAAKARIAEGLRLAERLGGEAVTLPGGHLADDILAYARERNVTEIIAGRPARLRFARPLHDALIAGAGPIVVTVIGGDGAPAARPRRTGSSTPGLLPYLVTALAIAGATGAGLLIQPMVGLETIDLIFLVAVLGIAAAYGTWPALFASIAASLAYNYFFLPPVRTFTIAAPANIAAFLAFLAVALVVSQLAARVRAQVIAARARVRTTEALYGFSRKLAAAASLDDLLWAVAFQIASLLKLEVMLLMPENGTLTVRAAYPPDDDLDAADMGAARWAFDRGREAGRGADTLPGARRLFVPLTTPKGVLGVAGLSRPGTAKLLTPDGRRLLDALLGQAAIAIERTALSHEMEAARVETETERLRSALLASLSHDLKTPLASILGAATAIREYGALMDARAEGGLVETIEAEAARMSRFVSNLLDLSRLESGAVRLDAAPVDLADQVASAAARTRHVIGSRKLTLDVPANLPMVTADALLLEQVLVNLIENAAKYTPEDAHVSITGHSDAGGVTLEVSDDGPGIAAADLPRLFEPYFRAETRDRRTAGAGLGLAICAGFMRAMGGTITARNRPAGTGAVFTLSFPPALIVVALPEVVA